MKSYQMSNSSQHAKFAIKSICFGTYLNDFIVLQNDL